MKDPINEEKAMDVNINLEQNGESSKSKDKQDGDEIIRIANVLEEDEEEKSDKVHDSEDDSSKEAVDVVNNKEEEINGEKSIVSSPNNEEEAMDVDTNLEQNEESPKSKEKEDDDGIIRIANVLEEEEEEEDEKDKSDKRHDSEEENDNDIGVIRIRDIGSLRDQDDSSDDDIIEITPAPKIHSEYVRMNEASNSFIPLTMECGDDPDTGHTNNNRKKKRKEALVLRKKFSELKLMLSQLQKQGQSGLKVKDTGKFPTTTVPTSNANNFFRVQSQGPRAASASSNYIRMNSSQINTPINCIVTSRGVQQVTPNTNQLTASSMVSSIRSTRPHILSNSSPPQNRLQTPLTQTGVTQVVFDPKSGLLLCPNPQNSAIGNNPNMRPSYRAIQATPQFLAAIGAVRVSRPGLVNGVQTTRAAMSSPSPTMSTPTITSSYTRPLINTSFPSNFRNTTPVQQTTSHRSYRAGLGTPGSNTSVRTTVPQSKNGYPAIAPKNHLGRPPLNQQRQPLYPPPATAAPVSASFSRKPVEPVKPKSQAIVTAGTQQSLAPIDPKEKAQSAKTFPSLVVIVKPYLQDKLTKIQAAAVRSDLDAKVKTMLMQSPAKFTEWLIQKSLLRMDHKCVMHQAPYKLGMYSDSEKYPYSGGYVFTADCCPDKQLPVFQGSIFEASVYPPGTTMKLIYHWACQTPAPNVLQWVKITSYYLKNFYTLLRSVCVASLHEHAATMGGKGKYIEVGVVTLGTVPGSALASAKQTKIEILGVFDPGSKFIKMRLLTSTPGLTPEMARREKADQILTPLSNWVNRESVLLIDSSLEKSSVEKLGFRNVSQSKTPVGIKTTIPTNVNVMNYLKNIVPRMFQNTLCVLSRSLIQQFLDELSWRELWGPNPLKTFDAIMLHLVQMTKAEFGELLIPRLNKISLNPFAEWSYSLKKVPVPSGMDCLPDSIRSQPLSELIANSVGLDSSISNLVSNYLQNNSTSTSFPGVRNVTANASGPNPALKTYNKNTAVKRKASSIKKDMHISPPAKKAKAGKSLNQLQTLNTSFAVPLNPSDKYMFTPMNLNISDVELFTGMECWECSKPIRLPGHYRGTMKCSRCRYETCCSFMIQKHIQSHDVENLKDKTTVRTKLALARELDLSTSDALECSGCHFISGSTRRFARHLLKTGHKACFPKNSEPKK